MNADMIEALCLELIRADHEDTVVTILKSAGYWDDPEAWRDLGDNENNYAAAGAQQTDSVAALVEKLVNSADARLMNACLEAGIEPESSKAPQSVREGVARLIEKSPAPEKEHTGKILGWTKEERQHQAMKITLAATGSRASPCLTIVDEGEGQTPLAFPRTFMSLTKSNKLRVPFVQGKFNMGGTGALRFCGSRRLQLIVSRRNPALIENPEDADGHWGFTVVRREAPTGNERSSVFRYLAPVKGKEKGKGEVLHFASDALELMPQGNRPYARPTAYGSLVKLYNYQLRGRSNILLKDGLLRATDVRLPNPSLPVMFHECRDYSGDSDRSFANPCTGLFVRLEDNRADNLDDAFPLGASLTIEGQTLPLRFYGFKQGRFKTYLQGKDGVLFVVNGQTQGNLSTRFYLRHAIKFGAVADSLVTIVDCSNLSREHQEELFMNNREALADSQFRRELEKALEKSVASHPGLREFNNRRRQEKLNNKLEEDQSLADVLKRVMSKSDLLNQFFLPGSKVSNPINTKKVDPSAKFVGKKFPTYFRHRGKDSGKNHTRNCELGRNVRLLYDTDAEDLYFDRASSPGAYSLTVTKNGTPINLGGDKNLYHGKAAFTLEPDSNIKLGDELHVRLEVTDDSRVDPFVCVTTLKVVPKAFKATSPKPPKPKPPSDDQGDGETKPDGIQLPHVEWIAEKDWEDYEFDQYSGLKVEPVANDKGKEVYDFFLNEDNLYLKNHLAAAKDDAALVRRQYEVAMVLATLGIIGNYKKGKIAQGAEDIDLVDLTAQASRGLALMLIPIMQQVGNLDPTTVSDDSGED
ncbi:hypothetical protein [Sphingomicrobium flavum]|uniref:hypothetical protein n=1 Tax=Sphingomicrobium flavum TaxID=1229164 RepID=UPI0021AE0784|nr:hypothetical protein [Sphingomicrobium flavum]